MPFHKRWRELGEYSVDGGGQAGFDVVGGHVGTIYQPLRSGRIWHKVNF